MTRAEASRDLSGHRLPRQTLLPGAGQSPVIALVQGQPLFFTPLHELEMTNALQLKVFSRSATAAQATAARALVAADLQSGVLVSTDGQWKDAIAGAVKLAEQHSGSIGCRSLDVLHCATVKVLAAREFISTDGRQKQLATAMGLKLVTF